MPLPEQENNMDELLKAYARQRREQAEPALEMHPATRKLLHDEARRTFGATVAPTQSRPSPFLMRWLFGILGSALAVLLLMFSVLHESAQRQLPASGPVARSLTESKQAPGAATLAASDKLVTAPILPPERYMKPDTAQETPRFSGRPEGSARQPFSTAAAHVPVAAKDGSGGAAQEFVQVPVGAPLSAIGSTPSNVLSTFQLLRNGQNVRVVDADGSIYDGQVVGEATVAGAMEDYAKKTKEADLEANYAFKVAGTNRYLQQSVVFTGNALDMPVAQTNQAIAQTRQALRSQNATAQGHIQSAQNSRITGKVQVGGGKEFKIEAKTPTP